MLYSNVSAAESIRILLDKGHSEQLVEYLELAGVDVSRASPFAKVQKSDEALAHLDAFAQLQQQQIVEARSDFWSSSRVDGSEYQEKYYRLRDAKIRLHLALQALESMGTEIAALDTARLEARD